MEHLDVTYIYNFSILRQLSETELTNASIVKAVLGTSHAFNISKMCQQPGHSP